MKAIRKNWAAVGLVLGLATGSALALGANSCIQECPGMFFCTEDLMGESYTWTSSNGNHQQAPFPHSNMAIYTCPTGSASNQWLEVFVVISSGPPLVTNTSRVFFSCGGSTQA